MKTVFNTNREVLHAWREYSYQRLVTETPVDIVSYGRNKNGSLSFRGSCLNSYNHIISRFDLDVDDLGSWLLIDMNSPSQTTSAHLTDALRFACLEYTKIRLYGLGVQGVITSPKKDVINYIRQTFEDSVYALNLYGNKMQLHTKIKKLMAGPWKSLKDLQKTKVSLKFSDQTNDILKEWTDEYIKKMKQSAKILDSDKILVDRLAGRRVQWNTRYPCFLIEEFIRNIFADDVLIHRVGTEVHKVQVKLMEANSDHSTVSNFF